MEHHPNIGSSFDSFLEESELLEEVSAVALKQVIARQIQEEMKRQSISKTLMAQKMKTSRSQLDRLLDPTKTGISLEALASAAHVIGRNLRLELI